MSKTLAIIIATFLVTALGVLLVTNLSLGNKQVDRRIETLYSVGDPQFLRSMGSLLGPPIVDGNRAQALLNGDEIFPAMLEAIRGAQQTITFETYIYWSGAIGQQFAQALTERARAGVRVHVMLDWLGSGDIDETYVKQMEEAGIEVRRYNPLRWDTVARMNNRTHRKLLGRRQNRLQRRRWHRRSVDRTCAGSAALAGYAFPYRRAGGRADAIGVPRQLDRSQRARIARRSVFSSDRTGRRAHRAGLHELARRRRQKRAVDVSAVDRRGE